MTFGVIGEQVEKDDAVRRMPNLWRGIHWAGGRKIAERWGAHFFLHSRENSSMALMTMLLFPLIFQLCFYMISSAGFRDAFLILD
jgi:hypothetical protein